VGNRVFGDHPRVFPAILPDSRVTVAGVVLPASTLLALALSLALAVSLTVFLGRTQVGVQLRALATRPTTAELLGVPVRGLAVLVWAAGGLLSGVAMLLIAPVQGGQFSGLSLLILPALVAALIGLFRSFWLTLLAGVALGVLLGIMSRFSGLSAYSDAVILVISLAVLVVVQRGARWDVAR
jgi:branched-chain amino acid transport system permease protein